MFRVGGIKRLMVMGPMEPLRGGRSQGGGSAVRSNRLQTRNDRKGLKREIGAKRKADQRCRG